MTHTNNTQIKRILILGHKGFIGQHLKNLFNSDFPEVEVIGIDLPDIDLTSESDLEKITDFFDINTAVIMLATIKRQFGDTLEVFNQNLKMTTNLCHLLQKRPIGRFVFFSSSAVYGEDIHNTNITEETPVHPTSYYGMAKLISERLYWKALNANEHSSLLILRPPTIYGPGDEGGTYGPIKFANAALMKQELTLWGDGSELREFLFVDDIVDIVQRLMFSSFNGTINLASNNSYSFRDVLDCVESVSGYKLHINSRPRTKAKVDNVFSNKKLLREIGGYTFTSLSEGVKALYGHLTAFQ